MKRTHARKRPQRVAAALSAVLVTAGCATAPTQNAATLADQSSRYDGGVEQLLLYCGKLQDNGELSTAASICERAYNIDPTDPRPLIKLGEIFSEMEQLPQAASAYLTVLEQAPHNVEARYLLGKTYIAMGRHGLALQELQFTLTQSPEDARIYNALGIANGMLGNRAAAKQAFEEGLKVAPNDIPLRNNLGLALVLGGQHNEGIAVLQEVALDPAANATTIRNLRLAEGIAQSASDSQAVADANPAESTAMPAASQLASTATIPSGFGAEPDFVLPEPQAETPAAAATPSQPPSVPREPVTLTQALSPMAGDIQMADNGMPVYLDSDPGAEEPEAFVVTTEPHGGTDTDSVATTAAKDDADGPATEKLTSASMPQPILAPGYERQPDEAPIATGEMQSVVTADVDTPNVDTPIVDTAALPMASPSDMQTAALGGENIYSVQLASYRSADRAQEGWRQIRASALDLLQDVEPVIRRSDLGPERGIYFRLRTKPSSKGTANQLCSALQARGLSCLTIKENLAAPAGIEETTTPTAAKS